MLMHNSMLLMINHFYIWYENVEKFGILNEEVKKISPKTRFFPPEKNFRDIDVKDSQVDQFLIKIFIKDLENH